MLHIFSPLSREPHVSRSHAPARGPFPADCPGSPGLRTICDAGRGAIPVHVREPRPNDGTIYRSAQARAVCDLYFRLRRAGRPADGVAASRADHAIISQNGNAYDEGLSAGWDGMKAYWRHPTPEYRKTLRAALTPEATRYQYVHGVGDPSLVSPDGSTLDDFYMARPGAHDIQLSLFRGLRLQRRALSEIPGIFPGASAAAARGLGQERSLFSARRSGSVSTRSAGGGCPLSRHRALRSGNPLRRDRMRHRRIPGSARCCASLKRLRAKSELNRPAEFGCAST